MVSGTPHSRDRDGRTPLVLERIGAGRDLLAKLRNKVKGLSKLALVMRLLGGLRTKL